MRQALATIDKAQIDGVGFPSDPGQHELSPVVALERDGGERRRCPGENIHPIGDAGRVAQRLYGRSLTRASARRR